jgi:transposase InsO family protein
MSLTESRHERAAKDLTAIDKLKGTENWITWSDKVLLILSSHGFDSDEEARTLKIDDKDADKRIRATLLLRMEDAVSKAVKTGKSTMEVWTITKAKYGTPSKIAQGQLLSRFYGVHLQPGETIQHYINEKRSLQGQLNNAGCDIADSKLALMILVGARNQYESVCESLVDKDNLSVATVEERLIHAEEARGIEGKPAGVDTAMKAVGRVKVKARCSKCGKVGYHTAENCWSGMKCGNCSGEHPDHACRRRKGVNNLRPDQIAKIAQLLDSLSSDKSSDLQGYTFYAALNATHNGEGSLIVDSGATTHMTGQRHHLVDTRRFSGSVRVANNAQEKIDTEGRRLITFETGVRESLPMLCVPALGSTTLLSVRRLCEGGRKMMFTSDDCVLYGIDGGIIAKGSVTSAGLYEFRTWTREATHLVKNSEQSGSARRCKDPNLWHYRLGHRNYADIELLAGGLAKGIATSSRGTSQQDKTRCCPTCEISKARKQPFPSSVEPRTKEVLSLVVSDVCGKMQVPSLGGAQYFVVFVDVASERIFTYLLRRKSDVFANFMRFQAWAERTTGQKLKTLRTDNGGEYLSREFKELFAGSGVEHQTTVPYCSPQNGIAERRLYTLMNSVRSMLHHSGLGKEYWGAAVLYAVK